MILIVIVAAVAIAVVAALSDYEVGCGRNPERERVCSKSNKFRELLLLLLLLL